MATNAGKDFFQIRSSTKGSPPSVLCEMPHEYSIGSIFSTQTKIVKRCGACFCDERFDTTLLVHDVIFIACYSLRTKFSIKWIQKLIVNLFVVFFRTSSRVISYFLLSMAEVLHQLIGSLSHNLQGSIYTMWCRVSFVNSTSHHSNHFRLLPTQLWQR